MTDKVIDLEDKVASRANIDDLSSTKQIKKEDYLSQIVNQYDSSRTGTDKSESSSLNKIKEVQDESKNSSIERYNDLKAYAKSINLSAKFAEIDKKIELEQSSEAPVKKRSQGRER